KLPVQLQGAGVHQIALPRRWLQNLLLPQAGSSSSGIPRHVQTDPVTVTPGQWPATSPTGMPISDMNGPRSSGASPEKQALITTGPEWPGGVCAPANCPA